MKKPFKILPIVLALTINSFGQTKIVVSPNINVPKDSILRSNLISCLTSYLSQAENENNDNSFISLQDKAQTFDLTDEIKGIQKNSRYKNEHFYKPHLINVVQKDDSTYFTQISFIGTVDSASILKANFDLIANQAQSKQFTFSSPISGNTKYWKTKKIGNYNFHYKDNLNISRATEFDKYVSTFDKKLNNTNQPTEYYCCTNATEALRILGIPFKADYSGKNALTLSSGSDKSAVIVTSEGGDNFNDFDPHDLWHTCLHKAVSPGIINKPIDEGCAYLYGGSWGMSWKQIFELFKNKVCTNKQTDWLTSYGKFENFGKSDAKHLMSEYVINALLVQKIEKEKGFSGVLEFLKCGKYDKGNENYFNSLKKLTGIDRTNFSSEIWKLINQEKI